MGLLSVTLWGIFSLVVFIISFVIYNVRSHSKYFAKHNIPYMGGEFSLFFKMIIGKVHMLDMEEQLYRKARQYDSPIVGLSDLFFGCSAGVFVTDTNLLKNIFVKDFDHFANRRSFGSAESDFLMKRMLFFKNGEGWKGLRMKMSPTFTTGKIKRMFQTFKQASESMTSYMRTHIGPQSEQDVAVIFPKFTMDVIANLAFGLDSKAWEVPFGQLSTFEKMGQQFTFKFSPSMMIKLIVMNAAPKVADMLGFETFDVEAQNYFSEIIKDVIKRRRQTEEKKNDFIQLMLDAQDGLLKQDEEAKQVMYGSPEENDEVDDGFATDSLKLRFDDDDLLANSLLFFLAGFDGTHVMMQWAAYALALYPEVQEKLFEEVSSKLDSNDGELTYQSVLEMTYLEMVLNEIFRFFSPATRLERMCSKDYSIPGTNFLIKKGTNVIIPAYAIHHDPRHFPEPENFDPERFNAQNIASRNPYTFMPLGHGQRQCIGMRFALIQLKTAIAVMISKFQFSPCAKTPIPMIYDQAAGLKPKGGLWLNVSSRE